MGKGLGCIPSKASTNPNSQNNSSLVQVNAKNYKKDDELEALIARAQNAKISNNLTVGPQWIHEQQLLAQK